MQLKLKVKNIPMLLISCGFFITMYSFRHTISPYWAGFNILVWFGLFLLLKQKVAVSPMISMKSGKDIILLLYFLLVVANFFYVKGNGWEIDGKIMRLFSFVVPLLFVHLKFIQKDLHDEAVRIWYLFLKVVCYTMNVVWFLDLLLDGLIQKSIVSFYNTASLEDALKGERYVSFYGHPLESVMIYLAFLVWTLILLKTKTRKTNSILDIAMAFLGIAICGSKSGLLLAAVLVVVCLCGVKNLKYMIGILVIVLLLYYLGVFDMVVHRFVTSIEMGDLSTTRNKYVALLISNGTLEFNWLSGHTFVRETEGMTAALEYPVLSFAFICGILFTILIYIGYFIIPAIKVFKSKSLNYIACFGAFAIYVQGNNGICSSNDDMLFYAINTVLILECIRFEKSWRG